MLLPKLHIDPSFAAHAELRDGSARAACGRLVRPTGRPRRPPVPRLPAQAATAPPDARQSARLRVHAALQYARAAGHRRAGGQNRQRERAAGRTAARGAGGGRQAMRRADNCGRTATRGATRRVGEALLTCGMHTRALTHTPHTQ